MSVRINDPTAVNNTDHWATAETLAAAIQKLSDLGGVIALC